MAESAPLYRLVVFDELDDPQPVRELFVRVTGAHPTDVAQWVARVPGVWAKPLDEATTRALLDGLYELEIAAEAWRVDSFPDLGTPRTAHVAACEDGGFRVTGLRGEPIHWIPWNKIELISAGLIDAEDEFRDVSPPSWISAINSSARLMMGRNPASARRTRAMRITREPVPEVLIVRKEPRITIRPTRDILEGQVTEDDVFPTSQALLEYTLHRLLWSWYRRDSQKNPDGDQTRS
jgi:hypothetical protein